MMIFLWLAPLPLLQDPPQPGHCPVLRTEKALAEYSVTYAGRRVQFCCARCVREFQESPGRFLPDDAAGAAGRSGGFRHPYLFPAALLIAAAVAGAAGLLRPRRGAAVAAGALAVGAAVAAGLTRLADVVIIAAHPDGVNLTTPLGLQLYAVGALCGLLTGVLALREGRFRALVSWAWRRRLLTGPALLLALGALGWAGARFHARVDALRINTVHYATFEDYGRPPVPARPSRPALGGTWYRGNDERDPVLPNGGHYRTCDFTVRLETTDGRPLAEGDRVEGLPLWVSLGIDRSPNTKEGLYSPSILSKCFLTRESDPWMGSGGPIPDRVPIETLKPFWKWKARYPLGPPAGDAMRGIVYVCEEQIMRSREFYAGDPLFLAGSGPSRSLTAGGRFHYAIQLDLTFRAGRLAAPSGLWMGALYRTRKFTRSQLPYDEWFSEHPIPESDSRERNIVLPTSPDREDR